MLEKVGGISENGATPELDEKLLEKISYNLIETFCIVKVKFKRFVFMNFYNLIETFCIVKKKIKGRQSRKGKNLIETFCIVKN